MEQELKEVKPLRVFQCPKCEGNGWVATDRPGWAGSTDCRVCNGRGFLLFLQSELTAENLAGFGLKLPEAEFKEVLC